MYLQKVISKKTKIAGPDPHPDPDADPLVRAEVWIRRSGSWIRYTAYFEWTLNGTPENNERHFEGPRARRSQELKMWSFWRP